MTRQGLVKLKAKDRAMLRALIAADETCTTDMVELSRELISDLLDDLEELEEPRFPVEAEAVMKPPDSPEFTCALDKASGRVETLHAELLDAYPPLQGNLSIPGMLIGRGLGAFVANGMSDGQIVSHVLSIVAHIRQALDKLESDAPNDNTAVH